MKYKKSPLDYFLQQRISDNAKELKNTLNETLQMEQNCLEQIHLSINHCKNNIAVCEEQIKKCSMASLSIYEAKKFAFKDNLTIWNTMGHIQMISIEMKEYLKRLSVEDVDEWEQRTVIKSAYTAIYETSKKLVDTTGDIIKFIKDCFPSYDYGAFTAARKELTKFREENTAELTRVRKGIDAHRDVEVSAQIDIIERLHLAEAVQLITNYGNIVNKLGNVTSPIIELGVKRLQVCF
ncbi:hypothetical protein AE938_12365 [Bacteroides fragilis]|uniref:hypothetical protein n=1 Tax=Bacteroidales TaxID=171549 RepID=UPI001CAA413D|nr:hypothetical protein [Bacteroides fragilis]MBY2899640.1 hypothetical protein [Bacteroides fragilis]MCM0327199.1 hypothetical protein [Bacteroides fragilis]